MLPILHAFAQITLRRLGPEDLPDSRFLLLLVGLVYAITQLMLAVPIYAFTGPLLRSIVLDVVVLCGFVVGILRLTGHPARFGQTTTAVFGTGALLSLCMLPFNLWLDAASVPGQAPLVPTLGLLAIVIWSLVVNAHIFARAMSVHFALGLVVSITYFFLNYLVFLQFGPVRA